MPSFRYSAYKAAGGEVSGIIEADSDRDARLRLKNDGLFLRELTPVTATSNKPFWQFRRNKVDLPQLALMTRRLATLLGSAVPLFEALATLYEQEEPGELKAVLFRLRDRLAEGTNLAKALATEPAVFSESYISMVAAGEASGALEMVLERLAEFLEDQQAITTKAMTALIYPALMVVVGTSVMLFLLAFVIPKIVVVFESNKATLPFITIVLITVSSLLHRFWWLLVLLVIAAVMYYRKKMQDEAMRLKRDRFLLKLPLVGPLWQRLILSRFAKVLGLLLQSGVPVIKALDITSAVVVNREYRAYLELVKAKLAEGGSLAGSLKESPLFPPLLVHMVGVGERGGQLEQMLLKAGTAFEKEFDSSVTRSMALLEPLLILAMGISVGFVVIAVLLPIFQLNQLIK